MAAWPLAWRSRIQRIGLLQERRLQGSMLGSNHFTIDIPHYVDLYLQGRLSFLTR
ncbi:hypothetical protein AB5I41_08650 [Sphingomonas sp. MMS24-JH45]